MKKLAFFLAVFVSLNATSVVRKPEEEESQTIVQHDRHRGTFKHYTSVIQSLAHHLNCYFYAITWEGIFHQISWERIAGIIKNQQKTNKVTSIIYQLEMKGNVEKSDIQMF
jgi:hypothetical protein